MAESTSRDYIDVDSEKPAMAGPARHDDSGGDDGGVSSGQAESDADDLSSALTGLSTLTTGGSLESALTRIASLAAVAVPGAEGAGLTMVEADRPLTVVVSEPFVREVDDIQYSVGQGPCISAVAQARTVMSGSIGTDPAWPRFGPRVRHLAVHSALSLPLVIGDEVLGVLNVYAHPRDAFTAHAAQLGELFAVSAAVAVHNARTLMQAQRLAGQLQTALVNRAVIDQAIGILISRQGGDAGQAFATLRTMSQRSNTKVAAIAESIVAAAAARARARHDEQS